MAHGGSRANAGRKKGSATKRKRARIAKAEAEGLTPAKVMEKAMLVHYKAGNWDKAALIAKDLAPYVHSRLASVQLSGKVDTNVTLEMAETVVRTRQEAVQALSAMGEANGVPR